MSDRTEEMIAIAIGARRRAYAPYSNFRVGAAVRTADGRVFPGANVENASFGLSVCAERSAIAAAVTAGAREIAELVVVADASPPAAPCGLCRQMLAEFALDLPITLVNESGERSLTSLAELLPRAFRADELVSRREG
jgi:cytidine deaminase